MKKIILLFVITAILCSAGIVVPDLIENKIPTVSAYIVTQSDIEVTVFCSGKVEKTEEKNISYEIPLLISDVFVKEGETVKKGDSLFSIDKAATIASLYSDEDILATFNAMYPTEDINSIEASAIPDVVNSPIEGTITDINIDKGSFSSTDGSLVTISNDSGLQIVANISESYISDIKLGQNIRISGVGFENVYTGNIKNISDAAKQVLVGTSTQTAVETVFSINDIDDKLKAGYTAKITIITDECKDALVAPYEAVQQDLDNNEYVYIITNGTAYKRIVTTGRESEEGFEILSGISNGDKVVTTPELISKSGTKVTTAGDN